MLAASLFGCSSQAEQAGANVGNTDGANHVTSGGPLPVWITKEERAMQRSLSFNDDEPTGSAPPAGYRVPAEYEPVDAVLITWRDYTEVLGQVAVASAAAGAQVLTVSGPASIPGVPANRYRRLGYTSNTAWSRDYGPVGIDDSTHMLGIVDTRYAGYATRPADDAMPCKVANTLDARCYTTSLVLDGGNYMTDGRGNVFLTNVVYEWNSRLSREAVDEALKRYVGARKVHALDYAANPDGEPADGTGHIDMFAKLVGECKVIVAQTSDEPFKSTTDKAATYFRNLACGRGQYEVTRVKGWVSEGTWYTYTNSLIVNDSVIVPFYDDAEKNEEARRAYESAMPGYRVVGINSESTIHSGGSIHCLTKEIPAIR
ncbi:agmatine deiminase family protein [Pendulispora brunnea]|uniref:Agmatine deiminase family protein n=1 Tax=Pendulispora brunnea TaxID=2905690 RepID=A0ABZ2KAU5_9BACT